MCLNYRIPAFARLSCSAFENFPCAGTLLVPRVHCYTGKACTSSGQQMWEQGKQGGKQPLGRTFIFWEAFVLCLFTQKLCCHTGDIAHTSGVKDWLCCACVAAIRHHFRSVCFSHLTPRLPPLSSSPLWALSPPLLPSLLFSVNPTVTEAMSADTEGVLQQDNKGDNHLTATCDEDKRSLQFLLKNACWSSDVCVLHSTPYPKLSSPNSTFPQTPHALSVLSVTWLVLKTGQLKHFDYEVACS